MRFSRGIRVAGVTCGVAAAAMCFAAPSFGGVVPSGKQNVFNTFKSGKFHVELFSSSSGMGANTEAQIFTNSQFLSYEGETTIAEPGRVKGDLGKFGKVDLRFHKSGPFKSEKLPNNCTGTPDKQQKGAWKGVFKLKTEKSIVKVKRTKLSGALIKQGSFTCSATNSPPSVSLSYSGPTKLFGAQINKSRHNNPQFVGFVADQKRGASITRGVFARGKKSDFTYPSDYSAASVSPPAPYSGSGSYAADMMRGVVGSFTQGTLTGHLKASFLGAGKLPLKSNNAFLGEGGGIFRGLRDPFRIDAPTVPDWH